MTSKVRDKEARDNRDGKKEDKMVSGYLHCLKIDDVHDVETLNGHNSSTLTALEYTN